jgi:hypothetical protein
VSVSRERDPAPREDDARRTQSATSADASNFGRYPGWRRIVSPSRASRAVASTRFLQSRPCDEIRHVRAAKTRMRRLATCVAVAYRCGGSTGWLVPGCSRKDFGDFAPCFPFDCIHEIRGCEHQKCGKCRSAGWGRQGQVAKRRGRVDAAYDESNENRLTCLHERRALCFARVFCTRMHGDTRLIL